MPQPGVERVNELGLKRAETRLGIQFVSFGAAPGDLVQYQYKLEGADSDWSSPGMERSVSYGKLAPGRFRFLVRPVVAGAASAATAEVDFELPPPLWRRWWALTCEVAVLCALAAFAHRYHVDRLLEVERMRLRIARNLHDDLGASLTRMTILTELASQQAQTSSPEAGRDLSRIAEMARGMVDALGELVWAADPRCDDMASTARRVRRYATDVLERQGVTWSLETPGTELPPLPPEKRRHVLLIFQEALRNAARHAACSHVDLFLGTVRGEYVVRIRDNGRGLPEPLPESGSGLLNLRSRAAALGGGLSLVSVPGAGTDVTVRFPAGKSSRRPA